MNLHGKQLEDQLLTIRGRKHKQVCTNAFTKVVFKEVRARLMSCLNVTTLKGIALALGRSIPTVSHAMKVRHIPFTWLNILHDAYGIREMWILTGAGDMICKRHAGKSIIEENKRDLSEYSDLELKTELKRRERNRLSEEIKTTSNSYIKKPSPKGYNQVSKIKGLR